MRALIKLMYSTGLLLLLSGSTSAQTSEFLLSKVAQKIVYDEFGDPTAPTCLILLHGASGPHVLLYRDQAAFFAAHGYRVLLPHYFDATRSTDPTTENYIRWSNLVPDFAAECRSKAPERKVFVLGLSLGASVALAAGSQGAPVDAIAEWYGSLPDDFFHRFISMPRLLILHGGMDTNIPISNGQQLVQLCGIKQLSCDYHFYPDQGHGFSGKALGDADQRTLAFFR